jgi:hypothetical protein
MNDTTLGQNRDGNALLRGHDLRGELNVNLNNSLLDLRGDWEVNLNFVRTADKDLDAKKDEWSSSIKIV